MENESLEKYHKLWPAAITVLLAALGLFLLAGVDWRASLGAFLLVWANNLSNRGGES